MGKIEMDLSEYHALQEKDRELSVALKRERGLTDQLKKEKKAREKLIEETKKKIIKTSRVQKISMIRPLRGSWQIYSDMRDFVFGIENMSRNRNVSMDHSMDKLAKMFFKEEISETFTPEEVIEYVGVEDIKEELRAEVKSQIDGTTKYKLGRFDDLVKDNETKAKYIRELEEELEDKRKIADAYQVDAKFVDNAKKLLDNIIATLKQIISFEAPLFSARSTLNKTRNMLIDMRNNIEQLKEEHIDEKKQITND